VIRVENLSKFYGDVRGIEGVSFDVHDGEILGFLGPNGAGKTTTLRVITSYLMPTDGSVHVDDLNVVDHSAELRERIGYLPELNPLYTEMTVHDLLAFTASVRGITGRRFKESLGRVMVSCGVREVLHRTVAELSKGYRQRVGLAMAMIHDPKILILDEPTAGLDPNQIAEIRAMIKELGKEKTVVLSTHILQEVQAVADRMVILSRGQVVADGTTADLMAGFEGKARLELEVKKATATSVKGLTAKIPAIRVTETKLQKGSGKIELEYPTGQDLREQVFGYAVESGWTILEMSRKQAQLEDVFRSLTLEEGGAHA
jgi:ABC-2 type transport system ATP-binding protein